MKTLPRNQVLLGDAATIVAGLLSESVDCVVTSPPYFRLRDYGHPEQLGQEAHVGAWVDNLRVVLQGVRRVLKPRGSVWLNVADGYSRHARLGATPKSLLLAPERLAVALQTDGWIVRNRIVWQKPNPLPQSARDRLSPTYETVWLLTRSKDYLFDLDAIREPHRSAGRSTAMPIEGARRYQGGNSGLGALKARGLVGNARGKNPGDVWTYATAIDKRGHQATFPVALIERPILATCPERICVQCDQPWTRPTRWLTAQDSEGVRQHRQVGELQRCDCFAPTRAGIVLDPFFGTGTVGAVAARLGRDYLGIELSPAYRALAMERLGTSREAA